LFAWVRVGVANAVSGIFARLFWHGAGQRFMLGWRCPLHHDEPAVPLTHEEAQALTARLINAHGELIGGNALARCLGYRTQRAFQMGIQRDRMPVETFTLPGRRGRYARTFQVAAWLASCDAPPGAIDSPSPDPA
jgi:hypothetical protein